MISVQRPDDSQLFGFLLEILCEFGEISQLNVLRPFCLGLDRNVKGSIAETVDEDEEILGSDDDEQEDPHDYTKGRNDQMF